ncbi:unnamed protein product [Dovyalis caffra]|uniref:Uncharacterized protein n=1 Tax=Dovyalis caffra TaxID=77055 RepID=A0AAV1RS61_9ROSI|nr:unnamed protein product [Dovyalis caffra]
MTTLEKAVEDNHFKNQELLPIPSCKSLAFESCFEPVPDRNNQMYIEYTRMGVEVQKFDGILVNKRQDLEPKTTGAHGDRRLLGRVSPLPIYPIGRCSDRSNHI